MAVSATNFGLLHNNPVSVQSRKAAEEVKVQEQRVQQEQTQARQDVTKSIMPAAINANVAYAIINGKPSIVNGNQTNTNKSKGSDKAKGDVQAKGAEVQETEQKTKTFYSRAYSFTATNPLSKDINIFSVAKGINLEEIEEEKEDDNEVYTGHEEGSLFAPKSKNAAKLEQIHWVSEDLYRAYPAKISIKNQNSSLLAKTKCMFSGAAANAYAATQETMSALV